MQSSAIIIQSRFCGPDSSGNGGFVCGLIANYLRGTAQVTLRQPPPLDQPLGVEKRPDGTIEVFWRDQIIADARISHFDLDIPPAPTLYEAQIASTKYIGFNEHSFPNCFVCGPNRKPTDGLRIFAGPVTGKRLVAAPWIPAPELGGQSGYVRPEFVWACLDCPGYFSLVGDRPLPMLLGRLTAALKAKVPVGQETIVIGWPIGHDGRKHYAGTALFSSRGILFAQAKAVWIEI